VECGALDGERSSNTIWLERARGWTGLLVEMDPYFYTQLIGKSRQSWSINACLSPQPYVTQVQQLNALFRASSSLRNLTGTQDTIKSSRVFSIGFDSWRCRAQGVGQAWVDLECHDVSRFMHESTVKATFNTPRELLGGYRERKSEVLYETWVTNPLQRGCRKLNS